MRRPPDAVKTLQRLVDRQQRHYLLCEGLIGSFVRHQMRWYMGLRFWDLDLGPLKRKMN